MKPEFETFSQQHFYVLFAIGIVAISIILIGRKLAEPSRSDLGLALAGITFSTVILDAVFKLYFGTYDYLVDLPFFLCDAVALSLPFVLVFKNRKWIGIFYFWALAGTFQAILTPDLSEGFPDFQFFRYFIGHAGIMLTMLYTVVIGRIRINWKDFVNAIIYAQLYLIGIHIINHLFQSNYSYTVQKPPVASILDLFGPWPWYILVGELFMIVLFVLLMIPFIFRKQPENVDIKENEGLK